MTVVRIIDAGMGSDETWVFPHRADALDAYRARYEDDPPTPFDLSFVAKNGRRVGDLRPPSKPIIRASAPPAPIPAGTRDPSAERGGQADIEFPTPAVDWGEVETVAITDAAGPPLDLDQIEKNLTRGPELCNTVDNGSAPSAVQEDTSMQTETATPAAAETSSGPFVKASQIMKRVKAFVWGGSGVGKTTTALRFPGVALLDLERGSDHYGKDFSFHRLPHPETVEEIYAAVDWLNEHDHEFRTLVIDPMTIYWEMLQAKWAERLGLKAQKKTGQAVDEYEFQARDWSLIKGELKGFCRALMNLDMNVVVTAREKTLYADGEFMKKIGVTFDAEKNTPYLFDVEAHFYRNGKGERLVHVLKDRTNRLPVADFPTAYAQFEACFGAEELGRKAVVSAPAPRPAAPPAPAPTTQPPVSDPAPTPAPAPTNGNGNGNDGPPTEKQIAFLESLCRQNNVPSDTLRRNRRWFEADGVTLAPLTKKMVSALIDDLKSGKAAAE